MKQNEAEFIVSAYASSDFPREGIPEIALAGRSNVGKSSLINRLAGIKNLARTSSTPGKTQSINFYRFQSSLFLVDLPGYGFSKAGKAKSRQWKHLIEQYFTNRPEIALVMHLVDARLPPTALDLELAAWIRHRGIPRIVVATKADKLSGNKRAAQQRVISGTFDQAPVILFSAVTGMGGKEIWNRVAGCRP